MNPSNQNQFPRRPVFSKPQRVSQGIKASDWIITGIMLSIFCVLCIVGIVHYSNPSSSGGTFTAPADFEYSNAYNATGSGSGLDLNGNVTFYSERTGTTCHFQNASGGKSVALSRTFFTPNQVVDGKTYYSIGTIDPQTITISKGGLQCNDQSPLLVKTDGAGDAALPMLYVLAVACAVPAIACFVLARKS